MPARLRLLASVALVCLAPIWRSAAAEFKDLFAVRELSTAALGDITGSNTLATVEAGEPQHGGKPGGHSVWISWQAPADGVATFWTAGSSFDTLLSAYYFGQPADTQLNQLKEAARNDDDFTNPSESLIQFGALAGVRYAIAVDGYRGATGQIRLRWNFLTSTSPPPVIVSVSDDRAARAGAAVTLTVDMQTSPNLDLQWRLNDNSLDEENSTMVISNLQPANLGLYTLRIRIGQVRFETRPVEVQINSEGQTNALARDKLFDALDSPLVPDDGNGLRLQAELKVAASTSGVSRGYDGTQIFNTLFSSSDPAEPQHCGLAGGASYWFAYQPPADGTLTLDTIGSSYDTFVAVYTYDPPLLSYAELIPITCDNDSVATNGPARVVFAAPRSRQFLVVLDGVNGARGVAQINYHLDTNTLPQAPLLGQWPAARLAAAGSDVMFDPTAVGSPPLRFTWFKNETPLPAQTNAALALAQVQAADQGNYSVRVFNQVGQVVSPPLQLRVVLAPQLAVRREGGLLLLMFPTVPGQFYTLERRDPLAIGGWLSPGGTLAGDGSTFTVTNAAAPSLRGFFRLRVE